MLAGHTLSCESCTLFLCTERKLRQAASGRLGLAGRHYRTGAHQALRARPSSGATTGGLG